MDQNIRSKLRAVVLECRSLLEQSIKEELQGRFGIYASGKNGHLIIEDETRMGHLDREEQELRKALLDHLKLFGAEGQTAADALDQFIRETAFTWLNRFVAFKMLEARSLIRETISRLGNSNGFKMWLTEPGNEAHLPDYEKGDLPQNGRGEGPRQRAYRSFVFAQCRKLSEEVQVLFDPDSLPSRFFPRPRVLKELVDLLNDPNLTEAWQPGNEETIGWVYQGFNSEELEQAFREVRISKKKFEARDISTVTQLFTPKWIVQFLVENTLGRLWLELHPDSNLANSLSYIAPFDYRQKANNKGQRIKSVKEITFLDPACGTMHFGLVAFDLFVEMYREEMANAGKPGWPEKPPVESEGEIPAAIIANNLHGIDIDLRAVQLSALTLYLKAKTLNPKVQLKESRLACANVHMLDGDNLKQFIERAKLGPTHKRILTALQDRLKESEHLGSLLRLEEDIRQLIAEEHERYKREGGQLSIPGLVEQQFEVEAGQQKFWEKLESQIKQELDAFVSDHTGAEAEQTFFAGEAAKGLRLLDLMAQRYVVVVTNPPYMSARKMNAKLKSLIAASYPDGKSDLYAAFIQRCLSFASPKGWVGMLTMHSFMFISSYEKLRTSIRKEAAIESMAHLGPALFDVGNPGTLQTSAYVFRQEEDPKARQNAVGTYFRLVKEPDSEAKRRRFEEALINLRAGRDDPIVYRYSQGGFDAIPGSPWVYWITPGLREVFEKFPKLGEIAQPRVGLQTGDNFRFLRFWWEAGLDRIGFGCKNTQEAQATGKRWFPYMKGGGFKRWYGNQEYVVNWERDGKEIKEYINRYPYLNGNWEWVAKNTDYYFRRGVTYSYLTSGNFSARLSLGGFIFDVAGSSLFPNDMSLALAVLNSRFALYALQLINPTVNFQVGDLARLPVPSSSNDILREHVDKTIALAKTASEEDETTWDFVAPPDWPDGTQKVAGRHAQLAEIERQIDEEVYRLYGISDEDRQAIEAELATGSIPQLDDDLEETEPGDSAEQEPSESASREALAKAWISYAVGVIMGQFRPGVENGVGRGRFDSKTAEQLQALEDQDGLVVVDPTHPDDIASKVLCALDIMFGEDEAAHLVKQALNTNGHPLLSLRDYLIDKFFKEHVQKYRKRPIYWYLRSAKGSYGLWLYYHRLDRDIFFKALLKYVEPKIRLEEDRLKTLRGRRESVGSSGREAKQLEKDIDRQEQFISELRDFEEKLRRAANLHIDFDLNDGVILNIAPLWELVPLREAKIYWEALREGKYDWSYIAYQLWPERVEELCRKDRSIAIAHGREDLCEVEPPRPR
jgi:hypothetical protein